MNRVGCHLLGTIAIMVTAALSGSFRIRRTKMLRAAAVTVILTVLGILGVRSYLGLSIRDAYTADQALVHMHNLTRKSASVRTYLDERPPVAPVDPTRSRLEQILAFLVPDAVAAAARLEDRRRRATRRGGV